MGAVVDRTDVIRQRIGDQGYTLSEACEKPLRNYYARRLVAEPAAALDMLLPSDLELDE